MRSSKPRRSVSEARHAPPRRPVKRVSVIKHVKASEQAHEAKKEAVPALENMRFFQQGLLSPEQKRELILAHATARQARNLPQRWLYIMGVAVSCLVVVGGWWMTVGSWVRGQMTYVNKPSIQEDVRREMQQMEAKYPFPKPSFAEAKAALSGTAVVTGTATSSEVTQ